VSKKQDITLICVSCGKVGKFPQGHVDPKTGVPILMWFAVRQYLCKICYPMAANAPGGVRLTDPYCSHLGAAAVFGRSGNQRRKLFQSYMDLGALTDYDAAAWAGMLGGPRTPCYWKRCGELRDRGVIQFNGRRQLTTGSDVPRGVSELTPLGVKLWAHIQANQLVHP
jgi:hypothetical protein